MLEGRALLSTITVSNNEDSGTGSLRQALVDSKPGGTSRFGSGLSGDLITLTSGPLAITEGLKIIGPGPGRLAISGGGSSRIFDVAATNLTVSISGLTVENGAAGGGAGLVAVDDNLTIGDVTFTNDVAIDVAEGGQPRRGDLRHRRFALRLRFDFHLR